MKEIDFQESFKLLTDFAPFGWQSRLFEKFVMGDFVSCSTCCLPTGLGKTSLLALWLIALAKNPAAVPRRLVYVVNRRTVVDQTSFEAEKLRERLPKVPRIEQVLRQLCSVIDDQDERFCPLAISTLRGQFADNRQWTSDPCRPAIVSGTVDMIGSRLLFDGYRCGFKSKPLHAGFLGTDILLVHDEAHLEPAFQSLCESIQSEQAQGRFPEFQEHRRFKVIELSATTRIGSTAPSDTQKTSEPFSLLESEYSEPEVAKRVNAKKGIVLQTVEKENEVADSIVALAKNHSESGQAILVFVRKVADLKKVVAELSKGRDRKLPRNIAQLAGPMRGYERERLATLDPVFQRYLPESSRNNTVPPVDGTVYLVSTSAGEVGVNISADHLVSDLTTFENLAQRLGRVNRFGNGDATIDIVAAKSITEAKDGDLKPIELAMKRTWELLQAFPLRDDGNRNGSPKSLATLSTSAVADAFSPPPEILRVDECLFDAWSLTTLSMPSLSDDVPGRPPIEDWLHGVSENAPPQTQVAWRDEVQLLTEDLINSQPRRIDLARILEAYPLKPHELIGDRTNRVFDGLQTLVAEFDKSKSESVTKQIIPVWIVNRKGAVTVANLREIADPGAKAGQRKSLEANLAFKTIVLPAELGGLDESGMVTGKKHANVAHDVADLWLGESGQQMRQRIRTDGPVPEESQKAIKEMRKVLSVLLGSADDDKPAEMVWYVRRRELDDESLSFNSSEKQLLGQHLASAEIYAQQFVSALGLDPPVAEAVVVAARFHDLGKCRRLWQRGIGNSEYDANELATAWAKSGNFRPPINRHYRHEFGSLSDIIQQPEFNMLCEESQDLVLHLVAAHHGRGRPHFPPEESFDPERNDSTSDRIAAECPIRFGRLQRRYGRWQLAWLESLIRAADYLASQSLIDNADLEVETSVEVTA